MAPEVNIRGMKFSKHRVGLALAAFLGVVHLGWLIIVGLNWGQDLLDWVYEAHHLTNPFTVLPLDLSKAGMLLVMVMVAGYVFGWIFVACWNKFNKGKK